MKNLIKILIMTSLATLIGCSTTTKVENKRQEKKEKKSYHFTRHYER
jgi:hypothetical protein